MGRPFAPDVEQFPLTMRRWHVLNGVLALGLLGFSLYVYPQLPERFPTHFDIAGEPDGWSRRSLFAWLLLPAIGLAVSALMYGIGLLVPQRPKLVNLPDKKKLLELPEAVQRWVLEAMSLSMYRTVTVLLVMFCILQYGSYRAAVNGSARGEILTGVLVGLIALPIVSLSALVTVQARLNRAHRAWRTGQPLQT